jgi:hypothetical protein
MLEKNKQRTDILKILNSLKLPHEVLDGHYDTEYNGIQHNDILPNDNQH